MGFRLRPFSPWKEFYSGGDEPQFMLFYLAKCFLIFSFSPLGTFPGAHSSVRGVDWTGLALILFRSWVYLFTGVI